MVQSLLAGKVKEDEQVFTGAVLRRGAGYGSGRMNALLTVPAPSMAQMQGSNEPAKNNSLSALYRVTQCNSLG
jgi:hypothetical protein